MVNSLDVKNDEKVNKLTEKIYTLIEKNEISVYEFGIIFRKVRKGVLENARITKKNN